MNIHEYLALDPNEKPLDRIVEDGGFCAIFRNIACVGDSLSSGEFEAIDLEGNRSYHDMFEYSWGQFIARDCGSKVYNFSRGGMTAKEYLESFAENNGFWGEDKLCEAYIIALGVNDLFGLNMEVGTVADICDEDPDKNAETFAGYFGKIIQKYKKLQPKARFFLLTAPFDSKDPEPKKEALAELMRAMAEKFDFTYVVDLNKYGPRFDEDLRRRFYLYGHLNPMGYRLIAKMVESYIDYIVRHNPEDFYQLGFIGKPQYDDRLDK
ncbi:MAG: SGNH/GDSL hydrolase family protein [Oscillospiraceae bacterium]|nr:SGNH/GDSL hydrolase family protein [Oscillospiraceae bacterium]